MADEITKEPSFHHDQNSSDVEVGAVGAVYDSEGPVEFEEKKYLK